MQSLILSTLAITPNTTSYQCQVPSLTGAVPSLISWLHFSRISVDIGNLKQLFIGLEFSIYLYLLVHTHKSIHSLSLSLSLTHTHTLTLSPHTHAHTLSPHTHAHTLSLFWALHSYFQIEIFVCISTFSVLSSQNYLFIIVYL